MVINYKKITLSKEDYNKLLAVGTDLEHAKYELERAKKVGIDVKEIEETLLKAIDLRQKILEEYKPEEV